MVGKKKVRMMSLPKTLSVGGVNITNNEKRMMTTSQLAIKQDVSLINYGLNY